MAENKERGSLVVVEGTDGSGKGTQIQAVGERLDGLGLTYRVIDFPRYGVEPFGVLIGRYLAGEFGTKEQVHPQLISPLYAADRLMAAPQIRQWQNEGHIVLSNRYTPSNKAFQGAKIIPEQREGFFRWVDGLEYQHLGLPKEDAVVLLKVTAEVGMRNVLQKSARDYLEVAETRLDVHEKDAGYQTTAGEVYMQLAAREPHWVSINCLQNGEMRPKQDITEDIIHGLVGRGIISPSASVLDWARERWRGLQESGIRVSDYLPDLTADLVPVLAGD